jgi:phospholipase C
MGYYTRKDIAFRYALADAFTICDMYFCSVLGPTRPNRHYMFTGQIDPDGNDGGPMIYNREASWGGFSWTTYPERLERAGVSWRVYWEDYGNMLPFFKQYQNASKDSSLYQNGIKPRQFKNFADDVAYNKLPQVSWLFGPFHQSEHPKFLPARGAQYIYTVLETLASNPDVWSKTALFLTHDENDGYFDHVRPPTPPPGTPGEYITAPLPKAAGGIAGPIGLGFRVPTVVISPWSQGGWVSSEIFDHTSLLRFLEARFGVKEPNISAWRRKTCGDLTSTLRMNDKRRSFPVPRSPADKALQEMEACWIKGFKPTPRVPREQTMPRQERGKRKQLASRPYNRVGESK